MRGWNSNKWNFWNRILVGICIVTAVALAAFLFWYRYTEKAKTETIANKAESVTKEENDHPKEEDLQQSEKKTDSTNGEPVLEEAEDVPMTTPETDTDLPSEKTEGIEITGISWRGDEFLTGDDIGTRNAPALLEQRIEEEGYQIPVDNRSLTGAGTLSQMRLAGVEEREIQWYLKKHLQENDGEASQMETGIRNFASEELERTDKTYFPVILMGYYGGWGNDPEELADQIHLILNTYENSDQYLVLGLHPISGGVNPQGYQQVMEDAWGEQYIDLSAVLNEATAASYEGQQKIADAVFEKLTDLGYLT